jgi:hypothetical protein
MQEEKQRKCRPNGLYHTCDEVLSFQRISAPAATTTSAQCTRDLPEIYKLAIIAIPQPTFKENSVTEENQEKGVLHHIRLHPVCQKREVYLCGIV